MLVLAFPFPLFAGIDMEHGDRQPASARQQSGNMGSEFRIRAFVGGKQQPFEIGHKVVLLKFLALQPRLFVLREGKAG